MKILYQWALLSPAGWQEIDASEWSNLPKKDIPKTGEIGGLDNEPGWLRNVNVQGLTCEGYDHIAIEEITIGNDTGVKLTVWNDDPDDASVPGVEDWVNEPQAIVWTVLPLAPDPKHGMAINTRQSCVRYASGDRYTRLERKPPQNTTVRPWSEFVPPDDKYVRHGVWLEQTKFEEHKLVAPQDEWGWMHWVDHLPASETEIDTNVPLAGNGTPPVKRKLKEQRAQGRYRQAEHTITYYQRDTNRASGVATYTNENVLHSTTAGSGETETVTPNAATLDSYLFTSDSGTPNSASWPNGTYRAQINCTAASAGLTYRVDQFSAATDDLGTNNSVIGPQAESAFSGTGLKLGTVSGEPTGEDATWRYYVGFEATGDSHGDAMTIQYNTDSYADGPWTTGSPYVPPVTRFTRRIIGPAITRAVILFLTGVYNLFK